NKTFPIKRYARHTFTYETEGENAVGRSGITFTVGPDGMAAQVVVENLNVRGEGTFKRADERKEEQQSSKPQAPEPQLSSSATRRVFRISSTSRCDNQRCLASLNMTAWRSRLN